VKDTTTTTTTATQPSFPAHGTPTHEDAEKPVTGDAASKAQAAAVKAVGSGTAGAVTTDFQGNGYEVTVTKSDGSTVEIHLDSSFNVLQGPGGPGGGHHGGFGQGGPRNGETTLTGDTATKAKAAALAKVGGTADSATTETDSSNSAAAYEVHVTKTDGSHAEVILDKDFNVLSVDSQPQHGPYGPGANGASGSTAQINGFFLGR
jgi:uncharacterized membrane protein YkoI